MQLILLPGPHCQELPVHKGQRVKGKLPAQRAGRQQETEAASPGLCACPATDPRVMQSCVHILAVVCLPRNHGGYGWLCGWENHILIPFFHFGRNGNPGIIIHLLLKRILIASEQWLLNRPNAAPCCGDPRP